MIPLRPLQQKLFLHDPSNSHFPGTDIASLGWDVSERACRQPHPGPPGRKSPTRLSARSSSGGVPNSSSRRADAGSRGTSGARLPSSDISRAAAVAPVSGGITSTSRLPPAHTRVTRCGSCSPVVECTGTVRPAKDTPCGMTGQYAGFTVTPVMRPQRSPSAAVRAGSSRARARERGHHRPSSPPGADITDKRAGGDGARPPDVVRSMLTVMARTCPRGSCGRPGAADHRKRHPQRSRCAKNLRCVHRTPPLLRLDRAARPPGRPRAHVRSAPWGRFRFRGGTMGLLVRRSIDQVHRRRRGLPGVCPTGGRCGAECGW